MERESSATRAAFAARLRHLISSRRRSDGSSWSIPALAQELTDRGTPVTRQHLWQLTKGRSDPGWDLVAAISDVFGISTDQFAAEPVAPDATPAAVMYRAGSLDATRLQSALDYISFLESQSETREDADGQ